MKITGYRSLTTTHDWGRRIGDANGAMGTERTPVPILVLETDGGVEGIALGAHPDIDRVFPAVEGEDPRAVAALYDRMLARVFKSGHAGATFGTIGAVDTAIWDLKAKLAGEPLWRLLGGRERFVPAYGSGLDIAIDDDALAALYARFAERGITAGKLKGGRELDRDLVRLGIVRDALGAAGHPVLMLDANESWRPAQAVSYVAAVEERFDLAWIEEPVRRWDSAGLAHVRQGVRTAVATGENLTGLEQFRPLFDAGAVEIVQPGGVWGITHALRVATLAHAHDLPISPVGFEGNPSAHVATAIPNHLATELQDLELPYGLRIDQTYADGGIVLGDAPGLGIEIDEASIVEPPLAPPEVDGPHVRPSDAGLRFGPFRSHADRVTE